jgi:hypothetical protein
MLWEAKLSDGRESALARVLEVEDVVGDVASRSGTADTGPAIVEPELEDWPCFVACRRN